ncbi:MAG: soluble lytic murein transglycosylase-like protein, partial [Myxococcota bacterium]
RVLINKFAGDAKLAIAAYHAGPGIVAARGEIPYKQTRKYVKAVLKHYLKYRDGRL